MNGEQFLHRFQFDDNAIFNQEIDAVPSLDLNVVVNHWQPDLMIEVNAILVQLITEARVIRAFEAAGSQRCVDLQRRGEFLSDRFVKQKRGLRFLSSPEVESYLQAPIL